MGWPRLVPTAFALLLPPTWSHPVSHEQESLRAVGGPPVVVAARVAGRGVTYGGGTSDGDPFVLTLSSGGTRLARVVDQWRAPCSSGKGYLGSNVLRGNLKVAKRGAFAGAARLTADLGGGTQGVETNDFSGVLRGKRASGKWHVHVDVMDTQSGTKVDDCDLKFNFSARSARGHIFGGSTSARAPVVVQVAANGRKVSLFRIGWSADCTPPGVIQFGEAFANFPISSGRFGDDFFLQNPPDQSGQTDRFDYKVHGRVGRRAASGTFQGMATRRDAAGNPLLTCTGTPLTWTAASG